MYVNISVHVWQQHSSRKGKSFDWSTSILYNAQLCYVFKQPYMLVKYTYQNDAIQKF